MFFTAHESCHASEVSKPCLVSVHGRSGLIDLSNAGADGARKALSRLSLVFLVVHG